MAGKRKRKQQRARQLDYHNTAKLNIESLDPRIMLDAAGLIDGIVESPFAAPDIAAQNGAGEVLAAPDLLGSSQQTHASAVASSLRHEFVFIDTGVQDQDVLIADLQASRPGILREVVRIDSGSDGLKQIANALEGRTDIDAIHILSHGDEGVLNLGDAEITTDALSTQYAEQLQAIGQSLSADADILIYGCDLAGDAEGREFTRKLSQLTSADVAASDDLTGHASLSGDWDLEQQVGSIETEVAVSTSAQALWVGVLAPPTAVDDFAVTSINTPITVNVVGNDNDPDGDPLTVSIVDGPEAGTAVVVGNQIQYTPANALYEGVDTLKYEIDDGNGGTDIAKLNLEVGNLAIVESLGTLDTKHYIPPMYGRENVDDHSLHLTTDDPNPFVVTISDGAGNVLGMETIDRNNSADIQLNLGAYADVGAASNRGVVEVGELNAPNTSDGLILTADVPFYANVRHRHGAQGMSLTAKGIAALGDRFRVGQLIQTNNTTGTRKANFISVMATEPNTMVTFSDFAPSTTFVGGFTPGTVTLQEGESIVIAMHVDDNPTDPNAFMGALITSDNLVVVNTGSWLGGESTNGGRDIGADQIVPVDYLGTDFVLAKGQGTNVENEHPIVIADTNGTEIYLNGSALPIATINAGDWYSVDPSNFDATSQSMYIRTSEPAYVYQNIMANSAGTGQGLNFVPALDEGIAFQDIVISDPTYLGAGVINVVARDTTTVVVNGVTLTGGLPVPGLPNFVIYEEPVTTADVILSSDAPAFTSFSVAAGARGAAGYFAGFPNSFAVDDVVCIKANQNIDVDVLSNDIGDIFDFQTAGVENPANGMAMLNPDGTVAYMPDPDFVGTDTFRYTVVGQIGGEVRYRSALVTVEVKSDAQLGIAKDATVNGNQIVYDYYLENLGLLDAVNITVPDDLDAIFGAGNYTTSAPTIVTASPGFTVNSGFDGSADTELIGSGATIPSAGAAHFQVTVDLINITDPQGNGLGTFSNQVAVMNEDPDGVSYQDASDDGTNPDTDGDANPSESGENDPTVVTIPLDATVGVAKDATVSGNDITYTYSLEHFGNTESSNISLVEDLDAVFGAGNYSVTTVTKVAGPASLTVNGGFDGLPGGDTELIGTGSSLLPGETAVVQIVVTVVPLTDAQGNGFGVYHNTVVATAEDALGGTYTDDSVDGTDPDGTDNDGDPDEMSPTIVGLVPDATVGVAKDAAVSGHQITYDYYLENLGNSVAQDVSLLDDLDAIFGAGNYSVTAPTLVAGPATLSVNGAFDGSGDSELIATGSTLAVGATAQLQVVVTVTALADPQANGDGFFRNEVTADSMDGGGNAFSDDSVDGTNPDPDSDNDANDNTSPTDVEIIWPAVAKEQFVHAPNATNPAQIDVTYRVVLQNLGGAPMTALTMIEDLDAAGNLGPAYVGVAPGGAPQIVTGAPDTTATALPGLNATWNGSTLTSIFSGGGVLDAGEQITVEYTVTIDPAAATDLNALNNQVTAGGSDPSGTPITDDSDSGSDPDSDNPGAPGDMGTSDDPTPLRLPIIALTKQVVGTPTVLANENWSVEYELVLQNTGTLDLDNLQIAEDLEMQFGAGVFAGLITSPTIVTGSSLPGSVDPTFAAWDGGDASSGNVNLFDGVSGTLVPTDSITIRFAVEVNPDFTGTASALTNQATASGQDDTGVTVSDLSDSGADPTSDNPTAKGDMGTTNDPTPLCLPDIRLAKQVDGQYVDNGDGTWTIPYQLVLENTGTTDLNSPSITDNIQSQLGAAVFASVANVAIDAAGINGAGGGTAPGVDATWDGTTAGNILDGTGTLAPGDSLIVTFDVLVNGPALGANAPLVNQAAAMGTDPDGTVASDLSDDGQDPNGSNVNAPGDTGTGNTNDPTPIHIADLDIAKSVSDTEKLANGNAKVTYTVVIANNGTVMLDSVSAMEDLATQLGSAFISGSNLTILAGPSDATSSIAENAAWDGTAANAELIAAGSQLAPGDSITLEYCIEVDVVAMSLTPPTARVFLDETAFANASGAALEEDFAAITGNNFETLPYTSPNGVVISGTVVSGVSTGVETRVSVDSFLGMGPDPGNFSIRQSAGGSANLRVTVPNPGTSIGLGWADGFDPADGLQAGAYSYFKFTASDGTVLYEHDERVDGDLTGNVYRFVGIQGDGSTIYTHIDIEYETNGNDNWFIDHIYDGGTTTAEWGNQIVGGAVGVDDAGDPILVGNHIVTVEEVSDSGTSTTGSNPGAPGDTGNPSDPTPLLIPCVHIAKQVNGPYVDNGDGTWTIPYQLVLQNSGTSDLTNPSITDDIQSQLGAAVFSGVSNVALDTTGVIGGTAPGLDATWSGTNTNNILDGTGTLAPGDIVVVTFDLTVDGTALVANAPLTNQATGGGDSSEGSVTDLSDDGDDPISDNPGSPGDDGMGGVDDPTPILIPQIGLAKQLVGTPTVLANGNYAVTYQLILQNTGTVTVDNPQISEDLEMEFGVGTFVGIITGPSITAGPSLPGSLPPTVDAAWDGGLAGSANTNIFNAATGTLVLGDTVTVEFVAEVDPDATGAAMELENTAVASAEATDGSTITDDSDDGADPNTGEDDPTPLSIPEVKLAKQVNGPYVDNGDGTWTIPYQFVLENTGTVDLTSPSIVDNIQSQLGAGVYSSVTNLALDVTAVVGGTAPGLDAAWDGTSVSNVLDSTGTLAPGDSVTVTFDLLVNSTALAANAPLENQATGSGQGPSGTVSDLSDDGADPNTDNPGAPGDDGMGGVDDPTPIQIPQIGLAKQVVGAPTLLANGNYSVLYQMVLQNTGTVDLNNLQITEDLEMEFGVGVYVGTLTPPTLTASPTMAGSIAPALDASWDGGLAGSGNTGIFNGTSGILVAGDSITVQFLVEVDPDATGTSMALENTAIASGTDDSGTIVSDDSDGGSDPNNGEDDATPLSIPEVKLAKQVDGPPVNNGDGTWTIPYQLVLENTGTVDLTNPSIVDNIQLQFGGGVYNSLSNLALDTTGVVGGTAPGLDAPWNGTTGTNVLDGTGTLAPGDNVVVTFDLVVNAAALAANSPLENQATGAGDGPGGTVKDESDDGDDPNTDNPGAPGDMGTSNDATPLSITDVGLAKQVFGTPMQLTNDNWSVTYQMVLQNTGSVDLTNLQIIENLEIEFGTGVYIGLLASPTITGATLPGSAPPILDGSWDAGLGASGNIGIFNGTSGTLVPNDSVVVTFTVEVNPDANGASTVLTNQADAFAEDENGVSTTDTSDDGADANNGEDDPTPLDIPEIGVAKQINNVSEVAVGVFDVQYVVVIENIGTVDLFNLQTTEDLAAEFGAGFVSVQSPLTLTSGTATVNPVLAAPAWNGAANDDFFDGVSGQLQPGEQITLNFTVRINTNLGDTTLPFDWTNQIVTTGESAGGIISTDLSDDGTSLNSNNGAGTDDDPTPLLIPSIRSAKTYGTPVEGPDGLFTVPVIIEVINSGTVELTNLSLIEDIEAQFGNAFVSVANPQITANGAYSGILPTVNSAWVGDTSLEVINPAQNNESLDAGQSYLFTFDVVVDPDGMDDQSQYLNNQAKVGGEGENFDTAIVMVMDESGFPTASDTSGNDNDNPSILEIADVRTTKEYIGAVPNATDSSNFDVTFDLVVENTGTVNLTGVDLFDDFDSQWGPVFQGVVSVTINNTIGVGNGSPPTLNFGATAGATPFDGGASGVAGTNLLNNDGVLVPGEYVTVTVTVTIDPDATGTSMPLNNQAQAAADGPAGEVTDLSDDGTNPNSDNPTGDGDMGTSDDPTPLTLPDVAVTKEILGAPVELANGNVELTYRLILENTGLVDLDNLQITEDLVSHLGAGVVVGVTSAPAITVGPASAGSAAPTLGTWNGGLGGSPDADIFSGTNGTLVPGDFIEVQFAVEIDTLLASQAGLLTNQVTATADDPLGNPVSDESDDGSDPNGDNPTAPGDMGTSDDPTPLAFPNIGIAKQVAGSPTDNGDGTLTVPFELVLTNTGTVDLMNPSIVDNLQSQFSASVFDSVNSVVIDSSAVVGGTAPGLNAAWMGDSAVNILDGTGLLAPQDSVVVTFNVVLDAQQLAANSPLTNQAEAMGQGADGTTVMDLSDDGTDPVGDNGEGGTDDPTPLELPQIGLAKQVVGSPTQLAGGNYLVTYRLVLQNTGTIDLQNLQLTEDLEMEFGAGVFVGTIATPAITAGPTLPGSIAPTLSGSWNGGLAGSSNTAIFSGGSGTLVPGDSVTVEFTIEVDPDATGTATLLDNTAVGSGEDSSGFPVMDESDDGADPNNGENDPTPLSIADVGLAKQVNGPYVDNGDGTWTIPYQLVLENIGTVDLANPSITDNIQSQLGAAYNNLTNLTLDVSGVTGGVAPGLDATWTGSNANNVLDGSGSLAPGDVVVVTFDLVVNGTELIAPSLLAPLENQATGAGDGPSGPVSDLSDDGSDATSDNGSGTFDDPTPIEIPQIGLAKQVVGTPAQLANGNYAVTYQMVLQNTGTVDLNNLQITEDLLMEFGLGAFVGVITPPSITGAPSGAGSIAPILDGAWDGGLLGSANTGIFSGTSGTLISGDSITVQFEVEVNLGAGGSSNPLENTAVASGQDPMGTPVTDDSDSGADPNNGEDDPTPLSIPDIGTAKRVNGPYVDNGDGTWTIPYQLLLENIGTVDLANPSITDNIQSQLGAAYNSLTNLTLNISGVTGGVAPGLDATWDGTTANNILDGTGTLAPGDAVIVTFDLLVNGTELSANSPLENQANGAGDGPGGTISDLSDDGANPFTGEDDPTPVQIPQIGLAKQVVGTPTELASGNYEVTYQLLLQNTGTVNLDNLQITEDLEAEFGAGVFVGVTAPPVIVSGPTDLGSTAPTLGAWDGGLGGSANTTIFNGSTGTLVPDDFVTVRFTVEVDPDATGASTMLDNTATASALDEGNLPVTDDSDSGADANNGEGDPSPLLIPDVAIAKQVDGPAVDNLDGTYTIPYQLVLENAGTVDLTNPSITDDIASQLGSAFVSVSNVVLDTTGVVGGTAPGGLSGAWIGDNTVNILDGTGTLVPGDSLVVTFELLVDGLELSANSPLTNQAVGAGDGPSGTVTDDSDDGDDPNGNNPTAPGDMGTADDPTPISIPQIGLAKQVLGAPTQLANGNYAVTFQMVLQNTGSVDLTNLQITEDLETEFGAGVYVGVTTPPTIVSGPSAAGSIAPTLDASWNGGLGGPLNTNLFDGTTGTLVPNDTITVQFVVEVDPDANGNSATLENTATATGVGGSVLVSDDSDGGADPNNGEDDPTPLIIPDVGLAKQVNGPYVDNNDGTWTIPYQLVLENIGSVDLASPSITDNIQSQIGAAYNSLTNVALDTSGVIGGTAPGLDATWDGTTANNILDGTGTLAPGDVVLVTFDLLVNGTELSGNSPLENQAIGAGDGPAGTISDLSDDGADTSTGEDDPTPIQIPQIGLAKQVVGTPTALAGGNFAVTYQLVLQNTGTVDLNNLQITEDLETEFGVDVFVSLITPPSITAGPSSAGSSASTLNSSWTGGLGGSTATGIFNGSSGTLVPDDLITVQFVVEVDPDATGTAGPLENTAVASGEDAGGVPVTDDSDSGSDANTGEDDATPLTISDIGLAKRVAAYIDNLDGTWTISYELSLENTGTVDLASPSITDSIQSQLGAAYLGISNLLLETDDVIGGVAPGLDATWDGASASNILDGSGTLAPGDGVVVYFDLLVDGTELSGNSPLENQAIGTGDGPGGTVSDLSDDGPSANDDNGEGTLDDPTPIEISQIGLAKQVVGTPTELANGNYAVTYQLVLQNTGTVDLSNFQITEDLETEFGAGVYVSLLSPPTITAGASAAGSTNPVVDASWNGGLSGSANTSIFNGSSGTLVPNDTVTIRFEVEVNPDAAGSSAMLENTATATGQGPGGGTVTDDSDSGADANNGEDDPTPLVIPEVGLAKLVNGPYVDNGDGTWTIPYQLVLENTGSVNLSSPSITDNIQSQVGTAYNSVANLAINTAGVVGGTAPGLDATWDGTTANNILDGTGTLAPGDVVSVTFDLLVNATQLSANTPLENQATGAGDGPSGPVSDLSDDDADPGNGEDDPTAIEIPQVGLAKQVVGTPVELANGNFAVQYQLVLQNTGTVNLNNLQIVEDLEAEFGAGVFVGVTTAPAITSGPNLAGSIVPSLATGWTAGLGATTATNIFNGTTGTLVPDDSVTVTFTVEVDPDANGTAQPLTNTAIASGEDPNGDTVMDASDDGADANNGEDDPSLLNIPDLAVQKSSVGAPTQTATNPDHFNVTYQLVITNTGNVTLTGLDLFDDIASQFGTGYVGISGSPTIVANTLANPANLPTINGGWDANTALSIFNDDGSFEPGETITVEFVVTVDQEVVDEAVLMNNALATADDPVTGGEAGPSDTSSDDVTLPDATVGAAKSVANVIGTTITMDLVIENLGNVDAFDVTLTDDFDNVFGAGNYTVDSISLSSAATAPGSSITVNSGYNGSSDTDLLTASGNTLVVGDQATVTVVVTLTTLIDPDGPGPLEFAEYQNTATTTSADMNGNMYTDDSTEGSDPDPDGDGDPENNGTPTTIGVSPTADVEIEKVATVSGDSITYHLHIENTGNSTAFAVAIQDNLDNVFGAGNYTVDAVTLTNAPTGATSSITLNPNFSGSNGATGGVANAEVLDTTFSNTLEMGDSADIDIVVTVNRILDVDGAGPLAFGEYENTSTVTGQDITGDTFVDEDPALNVPLDPTALVEVVKSASVVAEDGVRFQFTLANNGNALADQISVVDDLDAIFGAGNYVVDSIQVVTPPSAAGSNLSPNLNFTGGSGVTAGVSNQEVLNTLNNNTLDVGDSATLEIALTVQTVVDQDGAGGMALGDFMNVATATNEDPTGDTYTSEGDADLTLATDATVGIAKDSQWNDATDTGTYTFHLEHFGNTPAVQLSIIENLDGIFGPGNYTVTGPVQLSGPSTLVLNSGFNGSGNNDLLASGSSLLPGETASIEISVVVHTIADPAGDGLGVFRNAVTITGEDSDGNTFDDDSVDGTDPDPDGDGFPTEEGSSDGALTPSAWVGGAKTATVSPAGDAVTFDFYLEHLGNTPALNVGLAENLDSVFGSGNYTVNQISMVSGPPTIAADGGFNGNSNAQLLMPGGSLQPGETAQIRIVVAVDSQFGEFENQATVTTEDQDGNTYQDDTHAGIDPDPDGDGDPRNNDGPTTFAFASGQIHGSVYVDHNQNGVFDSGELPIPGVIVTLTGMATGGDAVSLTTTTGEDGSYWFMSLLPGDYTIAQTQPVGFFDGIDSLGNLGGTLGQDTFDVTLSGGDFIAEDYNFGEAGLDPLNVGKDPFLASAENGIGAPLPERVVREPFSSSDVISANGSVLQVSGTEGDDDIQVEAGLDQHVITINGVGFTYDATVFDEIEIEALGGADRITLVGTHLDDQAELLPTRGKFFSTHYMIRFDGAEEISVFGGSGWDKAVMADSAGNDVFLGSATFASMREIDNAYRNEARGFEVVTGNAVLGGFDRAVVFGTAGADRLRMLPEFARLDRGAGNTEFRASRFERFEANGVGGDDFVEVVDSVGNDRLELEAEQVRIIGAGFHSTAKNFREIQATATRGGNDTAEILEVAADETITGRDSQVAVVSRNTTIDGFDRVRAESDSNEQVNTAFEDIDFAFEQFGDGI